jgi:hypothetical protein
MRTAAATGFLLALLLSVQGSEAQIPTDAVAPLFASHEPLRLRIEADFHGLAGDRGEDEEERDGRLIVVEEDGSETAYPLEVRTRGRFRLKRKTCSFPPLRLDVPRSRMEGSVFEGQDKLKLVTHCRDGDEFQQNVFQEYLIYRFYNLLTPRSLQVRLAFITYADPASDDAPLERFGFLIESEEAIAGRLSGAVLDPEEEPGGMVHPARTRGEDTGRIALFQYLIGNTDFSLYYGHNAVLLELDGHRVVPVPYDFDFSGLVDARYASPAPEVGTRNVRQRVYRGICRPDIDYPALYQRFLDHREEMAALVLQEPLLAEEERREMLEYLDEFWAVLRDPDEARKRIQEACRPI